MDIFSDLTALRRIAFRCFILATLFGNGPILRNLRNDDVVERRLLWLPRRLERLGMFFYTSINLIFFNNPAIVDCVVCYDDVDDVVVHQHMARMNDVWVPCEYPYASMHCIVDELSDITCLAISYRHTL